MRDVREGGEAPHPFRDPALPLGERVKDLLSRLSLQEKLEMMASRQAAVPRLGLGEFQIGGEAAHGFVSRDGFATAFPQTIGLSCSWDAELLGLIGAVVGDEARASYRRRLGSGGLCLFAPTVDMERDPRWGRAEEGYGEDPLLAGRLSAAYVRGLQGDHPFYLKAAATPKHFYANNNEALRTSSSSSVEPRLRREYYLAAFEPAMREAKAASLMTSYNAINGVPAMVHPDLRAVVKGEWGMEGFAVCDGGALPLLASDHKACPGIEEAAAAALKAGIDNFTEDGALVAKALGGALDRGLVSEAEIDGALARVLAVRFRFGQFDPPGLDPYSAIDESTLWRPASRRLALRAARESIVLLENRGAEKGAGLPLDPRSLGTLAVLGPLADCAYRDWYSGESAYRVTPLQALCSRLPETRVDYADGCDAVSFSAASGRGIGFSSWGSSVLAANRRVGEPGEPFLRCDWGWGNQTFKSLSGGQYLSLGDDGKVRASAKEVWGWFVKERFDARPAGSPDGEGPVLLRAWNGGALRLGPDGELAAGSPGTEGEPLFVRKRRDGLAEATRAAAAAEAAILFLGNHPLLNAKEEIDRPCISLPPDQERLAEAVCAASPRTVVVIVGSYPYCLGSWRDKAAAILYAPHGGQEAGNALADVLLGEYSPSGRLSMTWYPDPDPPGDIMDYDIARRGATYLYYRGKPLYPFGHGLGYAPVEYSDLRLSSASIGKGRDARIKLRLRNLGSHDVHEVVQLYVSFPGSALRRPVRKLADFVRLPLPSGSAAEAELVLRSAALETWDQGTKSWFLEGGECVIEIGPSSAKAALSATLRVEGTPPPARDPFEWIDAEAFDDMAGLILGPGEAGSSCLLPGAHRLATAGSEADARAVFERMDFGAGGPGSFEAMARGPRGSGFGLSLAAEGSAPSLDLECPSTGDWAPVSIPLSMPRGLATMSLRFRGAPSLLRFRFLRERQG